jgi:molybdenum cofactor cytidylyltransferase
MNYPCAVVLAAGYGRRFRAQGGAGPHKLLVPCAGLDGRLRPVLENTLASLGDWPGDRLLVIRQGSDERERFSELARRHGFETLAVPSAGMGDSLSAAIRARAQASGWLVVLGDMPWIRSQTLHEVAAALARHPIAVPLYQGRQGHPVGFAASQRAGLERLSGDAGARHLLSHPHVAWVEVTDPGVLRDVDVLADLEDTPFL